MTNKPNQDTPEGGDNSQPKQGEQQPKPKMAAGVARDLSVSET